MDDGTLLHVPGPYEDPKPIREIREIRRRLWEGSGRDLTEYTRRAREAAEKFRQEYQANRKGAA